MKEMGIDRTLLWPTLASVLEERVADDPDVAVVVDPRPERVDARALDLRLLRRDLLHADHQPRRRHRTRRIEELEYIHERGAKIFLIRVAPVPTWKGRKSFALPEFDPFWAEVERARHRRRHALGRLRLPALRQRVGGHRRRRCCPSSRRGSPAFQALSSPKDVLQSTRWPRSSATAWRRASRS